MNVLVIYAHPWNKSLNSQVFDRVVNSIEKNNHNVDIIDLNKDNFNPVLDQQGLEKYNSGEYTDPAVESYQKKILEAQHLVFVFPIWWVSMPAILKGFIDKVFLKNFAFNADGNFPKPLIKHIKGATIFTTMSSPKIYYRFATRNNIKYTLTKGVLKFSGIKKVKWFPLGHIGKLDDEKVARWLTKVEKVISKIK